VNDYYAVLGIEKNASKNEIKSAWRFLVGQLHPDKHQGQSMKIAERKLKEINEAYEVLCDDTKRADYDEQYYNMDFKNQTWTHQRADTNAGVQRETRECHEEQYYNQQNLYNDYNNYTIDQETPHESSSRQSESRNIFKALIVSIIAGVILVNIVQGCPTQKKPNRTPLPSVEYVLPKSEGSSIVVKSDILTKYFGISYEQRQSSNLFMKDSHEYRYNGNGTWTITKKGAINNVNKNYIDTNNKNEVETYLHSLGF
jgi:curved DNA-binding protein CbpA